MPFEIIRNDIVTMKTDAIVNAANTGLRMGGGVCGAIFNAAGAADMTAACSKIGHCAVGSAVITPGFALPARYVIHAVGPIWNGGGNNEEKLLRGAYNSALKLAARYGLHSIAFPMISAGIYGYPKDQAFMVALDEVQKFLLTRDDMQVYLIVFDRDVLALSSRLFDDIKSYVDSHYVDSRLAQEHLRRPPCAAGQQMDDMYMPVMNSSLSDAIAHALDEETFSECVLRMADERGIEKDSILYTRSNITRQVFSRLRSNRDYVPSKSTALSLVIGLQLNIADANHLLGLAGYTLSRRSITDVIISYFLENRIYEIHSINIMLARYGQPALGCERG